MSAVVNNVVDPDLADMRVNAVNLHSSALLFHAASASAFVVK